MVAYGFKKRFVPNLRAGLGLQPYDQEALEEIAAHGPRSETVRPKRQTIRAIGTRRHARPGETLQLYTAMRTKQCRKIGDARCVAAVPILLVIHPTKPRLHVLANGRVLEPESFAQSDGFEDMADMRLFWLKEHPGVERFEGVLIQWEPI